MIIFSELKTMGYQIIQDNQGEFPMQHMCKMLDVSQSGYYA